MTKMRPTPISKVLEGGVYILVAVGFAVFMTRIMNPLRQMPSSAEPVRRSAADAKRLHEFLSLQGSAPVVLEFMDFQCLPCRASWPQMKQFFKANPGVLYRPINLPLTMHIYAFGAAMASEVARKSGQFDVAFNDLFTGATDLDVRSLNKYLKAHNLDPCIGTERSKPYGARVSLGKGASYQRNADHFRSFADWRSYAHPFSQRHRQGALSPDGPARPKAPLGPPARTDRSASRTYPWAAL